LVAVVIDTNGVSASILSNNRSTALFFINECDCFFLRNGVKVFFRSLAKENFIHGSSRILIPLIFHILLNTSCPDDSFSFGLKIPGSGFKHFLDVLLPESVFRGCFYVIFCDQNIT
jgi:hypothetical protein